MKGKVYIVGAGPGDPGLLTLRAMECIKQAEVIIYDRLVNPDILKHKSPDATLLFAGKEKGHHHKTQDEINALLVENALQGHTVVRLKGGDPFVFGRGGEEAEALLAHHIPFEIIPGVTAGVAVPAYAGIPVTHRNLASSVTFVTGHEHPTKTGTAIDWSKLACGSDTLVFYMSLANLDSIVPALIENGRSPDTPAALISSGTLPSQQLVVASLENIAAESKKAKLQPPTLLVVGEVVKMHEHLAWFDMQAKAGEETVTIRESLREGISTGTCAAAAAKAAALALFQGRTVSSVEVELADNSSCEVAVAHVETEAHAARAAVKKQAGDDPDITNGLLIWAEVSGTDGEEIAFRAGPGVGTVTLPGLSVPPGEPAINPGPREMIRKAVRSVTSQPVSVTLSVPGGEQIAQKTFNPRLGIVGGLSILGTTGRVRPFSCPALRESLRSLFHVARATGAENLALVPGHIGERALRTHFDVSQSSVIEVSNEWDLAIEECKQGQFKKLIVCGHPGKLGKIAAGNWNTHSGQSASAKPFVTTLLASQFPEVQNIQTETVEGLFQALPENVRTKTAFLLANAIQNAFTEQLSSQTEVAVVLINMKGEILGTTANAGEWQNHDLSHEDAKIKSPTENRVQIVGAGPGNPNLMTQEALSVLQQADVVVGAARILADMHELIPSHARVQTAGTTEETLRFLAAELEQGHSPVVLVSGDPGVCSLARPILRKFGLHRCRIHSAVSSIQIAFARIGEDWHDAVVISGHATSPEKPTEELVHAKKIAFLGGNSKSLPWLYQTAKHLEPSHDLYVCENLTRSSESVRKISAQELEHYPLASLAIVLFILKEHTERNSD